MTTNPLLSPLNNSRSSPRQIITYPPPPYPLSNHPPSSALLPHHTTQPTQPPKHPDKRSNPCHQPPCNPPLLNIALKPRWIIVVVKYTHAARRTYRGRGSKP